MKDQNKTKTQLVADLEALRQRVAELEALQVERKRAEEEIRWAKEEWERTFDTIPDLVAILDAEQRIVRSNQAMADSLGLAPKEIVGTRCYECFHGALESPPFCPYIQMAKNKQTHSEEVYVERLGKDFLVTTSPLFDAQGRVNGCVHVARDITERKRAEVALRESEEKYRTLFETMVQGVVYQDAEGRITSANPAAERILGLTLDQMQGRTSLDPRWKAVHKDGSDFPGEAHPAMVALKTGTQVRNVVMGVFDPRRAEYQWIKVDAVPQLKPAEDKPYQVYTTFDDITERKQAEEALEERILFETLLSDLSATLVNLPVSHVDQAIQRGLEHIAEFLDVDRGALYEFSEGQTKLYPIHSYARPGIPPTPAMVAQDFPWYIGRLRQGEMILMERIDDLPAEAARDKDSALKMGIKSNLAIPLTVGGATLGVISLGSFRRERAWPRDVIPRLRLVGEIFASTLARKRAEEALVRHDREMAVLYETSLEINSQPDVSTLLHAIVRRAIELLGMRMGGLYLAKPDGETLELVVSYNLPSDYTGVMLRPGEGVAGRVTQTGKPMMVDDYLAWEGRVAVYADGSFRRVLGVPLTVGSRIIGVITVQDESVRLFEEDQVRLLSLFADQAAIAVENARLVEALRRQNEYRTALQETTLDLISRLNLDNLLENIVKRAGQFMETSNGFLDLVEPETNQLKPQVGLGALAESLQFQVTPGEGVAGTVWQTGEPLVIDDYDAWPGRIVDYSHRTIRSVIGVPLLSGSQVVGVLGLAHDYTTSQAFGQEAVELLSQFARLAAIAIENARLYETAQRELAERKRAEEALQRRNHDLSRLIRVGQTLAATLDPQEVTARLMLALTQAIGAEGSSVWLWDEEQPGGLICRGAAYPGLQRSLIGWRLGPGEGVATWVAQHGQSVIVPSVSDDPRFSPRIDSQIGFRTASLLVVPLRVRDQVIGALEAVNKHDGEFDTHDRFLLETLAPSAAIAIENARLVEALRQSNAELEARNEELDAFAHTVAHDLKNPVGPIVGFAEILIRDYAVMPEDERQRCIQAIARSGRKIKSIIEELLLLAEVRQVQVATEPLDMSGIVSEALQRLTDAVGQSHAEIVWPDVSTWPVALGYAPWVEEVWINYLSNALKYGGRPPRIELGAKAQPDGMARFWVRDNGPGIPPEAQSRLFTPFTRLDQVSVQGHGLGLSIARRIVDKLGGQVGVESQVEQGSVFSFTLPGGSSQ